MLGPRPSVEELDTGVRMIVRLFEALVIPSGKSVQGMWAELFLIATSANKGVVADAWRSIPSERYDFARGPERIEVKSSMRRDRRHYFSLDQLSPPTGVRLRIASVFTERSAGGTSLERIISEACDGLRSDQQVRLRRVAAETLGAAFNNALDVAFDREVAASSVQFYESDSIPRLGLPLPVGVSDVRFIADLTSAAALRSAPDGSDLLNAFAMPSTRVNE